MQTQSSNKRPSRRFAFQLLMGASLIIGLAACATASRDIFPSERGDTAEHIASPVHMIEARIPAGEFTILAFEKMHAEGQPAVIYIEGDGKYDGDLGSDPTPVDPAALRMAADDNNLNVAWLARPCQYSEVMGTRSCTKDLYTTHRYSPQMLDVMNAALDNIKTRYDVPSFELVGFGGGAAVAVELAAVRDDVTHIRTVAGILDTRIMGESEMKKKDKVNPFAGSLNPVDAASKVAHIPQEHEVAGWDKNRSLAMIQSFEAAEGNPSSASTGPSVAMDDGSMDHTHKDHGPVPPMMDETPMPADAHQSPQLLQ